MVREPRAEPARLAAAPAVRRPSAEPAPVAAAPVAQGPRAEPAQGAPRTLPRPGATGSGTRTRPDPLGGETLPLVAEVYGLLSWATAAYLRNRPFDAVLLRRDRGNREVFSGGLVAWEDHKRVQRTVIQAGWPERGPGWPAFLEGGTVLRITDAEAKVWLPRALRAALIH